MKHGEDQAAPHPIIVVRRRRSESESHHGGVWKIAYADFMTAMMAFFLVMWLINMTDDKTIVQVAAYFNPLRLTDRVPSERGIYDGTARSRKDAAGSSEGPAKETREERKKIQREQEIFSDVKTLLDEISSKVATKPVAGSAPLAGAEVPRSDGDVLRDPFDPVRQGRGPAQGAEAIPTQRRAEPPPAKSDAAVSLPNKPGDGEPAPATVSQALQMQEELRAIQRGLSVKAPDVEVKPVADGILVSLTDRSDVSMFAVGSAEPSPATVIMLQRVGALLRARSGNIVISGHTDGRAYRSTVYDNWRLSSARAHMAYHMLLRGGVSETRVERIEGLADRRLKIRDNALAAQNRRIEILLRTDRT